VLRDLRAKLLIHAGIGVPIATAPAANAPVTAATTSARPATRKVA